MYMLAPHAHIDLDAVALFLVLPAESIRVRSSVGVRGGTKEENGIDKDFAGSINFIKTICQCVS